jgi:drug/metabolite transporter (DMT)-like permease
MRYFAILLLVNLMWAFQFSGAKIALERLGPVTVTLIPMLLSTFIFAPFAFVEGRRRAPLLSRMNREALFGFALVGAVGTVASQLGLVEGMQRSLASNGAVLTLTIPIFTAALASLLLGERMNLLRWISFAAAIAGALIVSDIDWHSVRIFEGRYLAGNGLILLSCLGSAFVNSYSKKLLGRFSPTEVLLFSFLFADTVFLAVGAIKEPGAYAYLGTIGWSAWFSLLLIAVFSLSFSMILYFWVIEHIDVTQASLSMYMLPVLGVLLSIILLKEKITMHLIVGGALVFISTFLITALEHNVGASSAKTAAPQ